MTEPKNAGVKPTKESTPQPDKPAKDGGLPNDEKQIPNQPVDVPGDSNK